MINTRSLDQKRNKKFPKNYMKSHSIQVDFSNFQLLPYAIHVHYAAARQCSSTIVAAAPQQRHRGSNRDSEAACFVRSFATPLCVSRSAQRQRHLLQKQGIFGHNSTIIVFQKQSKTFLLCHPPPGTRFGKACS